MGRAASGSPIIFLMMRYLSGNSPITGLTLSATGLYFFFCTFFTLTGTAVDAGTKVALPVLVGGVSEVCAEFAKDVTLDIWNRAEFAS